MKHKMIKNVLLAFSGLILFASCAKKLNLFPVNDLAPANAYKTAAGYKAVLAKVYGGLSTTGNTGPNGSSDIQGLDEGSQAPYIRGWFNCQELPTDEAIVSWDDYTIKNFHGLSWSSDDRFLLGIYARLLYNITIGNEYLRESIDEKVAARGISGADAADIKKSRAEVRFLRAFNYWSMLDLFGKSTFVTEADAIGTALPKQILRPDLFNYIETELKAIDADLAAPKTNEYARVDQAAAWALLARMYLNAGVYVPGANRFTDAITYAKKVIAAGYTLVSGYPKLFMADNDKQKDEFIFVVACDGARIKSYGNTSFFAHAASGTDHDDYGVVSGWAGYRTTKSFVNLFADQTGATDKRALFVNLSVPDIINVGAFDQGVHVKKWRNIRSDGLPANDPNRDFADIDYPVFRLSEMYLIVAEAHRRSGVGSDDVTILDYMNKIRFRAYGDSYGPGNVGKVNSATDITLQWILDERGRELYWEGHRRTDLIRYGLLTTGTYLWPWKGGVGSGTAVDPKYNIFPVPAANRTANPNLEQNTGY